ncbi:C2 calcium-dependent domain-containing protein 4D-like [Hoplias malabaricus]|uniref:C2 calcium-dependent domain-containing protein 4D-like n=1 Tax=Hoplias malabaricus TaxID=27720 RepID=UPI003461F8B3
MSGKGLSVTRTQSSQSPIVLDVSRREKNRDMHTSAVRRFSLRDMALTPARVPPFFIPPLFPGRGSRRYTLPATTHCPRASRVLSRRGSGSNSLPCSSSDKAAMSLPHLVKITTPYGFITLGESPCVRRRESLFFQDHPPLTGLRADQQQCMESRIKSSLKSYDAAVHCCTALPSEDSCGCSKVHKCTPRSSSSSRKKRLKYFLKKRFAA